MLMYKKVYLTLGRKSTFLEKFEEQLGLVCFDCTIMIVIIKFIILL